nr:immunoglobulin heavy chain junction region [Macaca mulatta]MOV51968.1 immunoglobulin heavy chain junction region [Macaca mulatta]
CGRDNTIVVIAYW